MLQRRQLLGAGLIWPVHQAGRAADGDADAEQLLRSGGVVVAFRHALAPGVFDPPGFRLDDCRTQRNLSDEGRAQARRIGDWFASRTLVPAALRSSPWCRCIDTATLAFGPPQTWQALASPRGGSAAMSAETLEMLRQAVVAASARRGRFEVWVTHNFVLAALGGGASDSGEGLLLRADASGAVQVRSRLAIG